MPVRKNRIQELFMPEELSKQQPVNDYLEQEKENKKANEPANANIPEKLTKEETRLDTIATVEDKTKKVSNEEFGVPAVKETKKKPDVMKEKLKQEKMDDKLKFVFASRK